MTEKKNPQAPNRELSEDELDAVAGGGLVEPIVSRNQPIPIKFDGIEGERGGLPVIELDLIDLKS